MRSPPSRRPFAYEVIFRDTETAEQQRGGHQSVGDAYDIVLQLRPDIVADSGSITLAKRYVYLFGIDGRGSSQLLWPQDCELDNELLPKNSLVSEAPAEIYLGSIEVYPPAGIDTIIELSTTVALADACNLFNKDGVITTRSADADPLTRMLSGLGGRTRSAPLVPLDWSIDHLIFQTIAD